MCHSRFTSLNSLSLADERTPLVIISSSQRWRTGALRERREAGHLLGRSGARAGAEVGPGARQGRAAQPPDRGAGGAVLAPGPEPGRSQPSAALTLQVIRPRGRSYCPNRE